jgi:hypothetical protein
VEVFEGLDASLDLDIERCGESYRLKNASNEHESVNRGKAREQIQRLAMSQARRNRMERKESEISLYRT